MKEFRIPLTDIRPCTDMDNARLNKSGYIDTQHVRFYNNLPISMGGYRLLTAGNTEIIRGLFSTPSPGSFDLYQGRASTLAYSNITLDGVANPAIDRTPAGFAADPNNLWNFDSLVTVTGGPINTPRKIIYAHAAPNALDVNGTTATPVYYGFQDNNLPFIPVTYTPSTDPVTVSGGLFVTGGYLICYGDLVVWTNLNNSEIIPENNFINSFDSKIIQGLPTGSGDAPGGLLWTSSKLFRIFYTGLSSAQDAVFSTSQVPGNSTIISQNSVASLNNEQFWLGTDNFFNYNGVLNILPNTTSTEFLFRNLNRAAANKIASYVYPKYGEIHWLVPLFGSEENNYDIFYSTQTREFTITQIDRASGIAPASGFSYPILSDNKTMPNLGVAPPAGELPQQVYGIWQHEYLNDKFYYNFVDPIPKYFESKIYHIDNGVRMLCSTRLLPNFQQTGNIKFIIKNREFPQSEPEVTFEGTFDEETPYISLRNMGTFISYRFESNELNGSFFAGRNIIVAEPGYTGVRS